MKKEKKVLSKIVLTLAIMLVTIAAGTIELKAAEVSYIGEASKEGGTTMGSRTLNSSGVAVVPEDTGNLPGADSDYVFDQEKRMDNGEVVHLGDIEVVYEDGTPVEDGIVFNLFNMTVMRNESVLYTTKDGKLTGVEMIAGKEYKLGFDVANEFWHSHEVVGAYNSKKLIRLYARYEGQAPLYYDYFEGIDGEELAVPKIVIRRLGEGETAVQTRPTSCITSLIVSDNGYYADAGAPFRIVCKDNNKGKTVISDEGALTFTADANLHYEIVLAENPTYKMKEKVEFIIQMDSRGIYWMIYEGGDIENAADRLTYIEVERIDGKTDVYEGKTPIGDTDCGGSGDGAGEGSGSECTPQEYAFIYDTTKVTLSGMNVYQASEGTNYVENAQPLTKPIKFKFYNCSTQTFETTVTSENGVLPDVELYKDHRYIVYMEDSEYFAPNYYITLDKSGKQPLCTKCYGRENGFYLYPRKETVENPADTNRVPITLPVQIKQGTDMVLVPNIKVKLVSPFETVEATSDEKGYICVNLIEDINYVVVVEDDEYSAESFPMTIKDKSEYGAGKYPYDHTSCGGVNGIYLCEKGTEHNNDTTIVCPSKATSVTGMNFRGGRYVLLGRILDDVVVDELKGKKYDVLDVDVINMYRAELSRLAAGEFEITRTIENNRIVEAVYYIDADGNLQPVEFTQNEDKLTYKMNSLSIYNNVILYSAKCEITDEYPGNHTYDWKVGKKATSSKSGYKYGTCQDCGHKTGKITINKISKQELSYTKVVANGEQQIPEVIIKDSKNNLLVEGVDYEVKPTTKGVEVGRFKMSVKYMGDYSGSKTLYYTIVPKAPETVTAELYGHDDVKVRWEKSENANGYYVYYKKATSSKFSLLGRTTKTSYKKSGLTDGAAYEFQVIPYYKSSSGTRYKSLDVAETSVVTLKKVNKPTVAANEAGGVVVEWTTIEGATGYQISQATSSKKTKIAEPVEISEGKAILEAPEGKTRYYKVRAYKEVDGKKIYAPWSSVKSFK